MSLDLWSPRPAGIHTQCLSVLLNVIAFASFDILYKILHIRPGDQSQCTKYKGPAMVLVKSHTVETCVIRVWLQCCCCCCCHNDAKVKIIDVGTNGKPVCDFLLVNNANLSSCLPLFSTYCAVLVKL